MEIFWGSGSGPAWRVLLAAEIKKLWKGYMEALPGYERTYPPHWREV
ncbi:MAG TPA: hypothetical protein VF316_20255 [Polyangiaceae bacterium]